MDHGCLSRLFTLHLVCRSPTQGARVGHDPSLIGPLLLLLWHQSQTGVLFCWRARPPRPVYSQPLLIPTVFLLPLSSVDDYLEMAPSPCSECDRAAKVLFLDYSSVSNKHGGTVAEQLACSPLTKANRVQSPAGSLPDFCKWESRWQVFSGISYFPTPSFRCCSTLTSLHYHQLPRPQH
ncbi:hypothetical protein PR048_008919 [Dryococelus australis]|uniref:Uncharacterized protein n=1 Tax=Dryococelus australis TaxID=614101 RepID=A0ABQ9HZJ4_9NEOP|nr:hypothetical protein PR048_008919 [Dryococelus australis]